MDSTFWALEVKPGETVSASPGEYDYIRISQVSLGEGKKSDEKAPVFLHVNDQKFVVGTLCPERITQFAVDIVFDVKFQVSHGSTDASVFLLGYRTSVNDERDGESDSFSDSESEDKLVPIKEPNGKPDSKKVGSRTAAEKVNANDSDAKPKAKVNVEPRKAVEPRKIDIPKVDSGNEDDSEDDGSSDSSDDETTSDDEDTEDSEDEKSSDEEIPTHMEVASAKKRIPESDVKTPAAKKAKVVTPGGVQKTGDEPKKTVHTATPYPVKQAGKDKGKSETPKSSGTVPCKSCNRQFGSESALQAHTKAKHG